MQTWLRFLSGCSRAPERVCFWRLRHPAGCVTVSIIRQAADDRALQTLSRRFGRLRTAHRGFFNCFFFFFCPFSPLETHTNTHMYGLNSRASRGVFMPRRLYANLSPLSIKSAALRLAQLKTSFLLLGGGGGGLSLGLTLAKAQSESLVWKSSTLQLHWWM